MWLGVGAAEGPHLSYTYNYWGKAVPAPLAYLPTDVIDGQRLGVGSLNVPRDIEGSPSNRVYVLDSGNNRLLCFDESWNLVYTVTEFLNDGKSDGFRNPTGMCVTEEEHVYVADQGKARLIELDENGMFVREIGPPQSNLEGVIPDGFRYLPADVAVDQAGRIYVVSVNTFDGLVRFNSAGVFEGFVGAPRVTPTLVDLFWYNFATKAQKERMALFLPTEFSSIHIDSRGFVYVTVAGRVEDESIKRLNPSGSDILARKGFFPPSGDLDKDLRRNQRFVDVLPREYGIYSVLESHTGRIFTYDSGGHLLYVFGGTGSRTGTFSSTPRAMTSLGDRLLVLENNGRITVFRPTEYATSIHQSIEYYEKGDFVRSTESLERVLMLNANYDQAYSGIGRALFRAGDTVKAMAYFQLGYDVTGYSKAYEVYRQDFVEEHFGIIASLIVALLLLLVGYRRWLSRTADQRKQRLIASTAGAANGHLFASVKRVWREVVYSFHLIFHPIEGFAELKHEKKGSAVSATLLLGFLVAAYLLMRRYTGFVVKPSSTSEVNVTMEVLGVLVPFALWCVVNWAFTSLMDGKGTLRDVYVATAYALVPIAIIVVPLTIWSNFIVEREVGLYSLALSVGIGWAALLVIIGTGLTHDYSSGKTVLTVILTVVGIATSIFLILLFFDTVGQVVTFVRDVYAEVQFRR
jgi:tetratricopeptide (TPR) repeat protein